MYLLVQDLGADSIKRCHRNSIGNPIVEIRWSYDRLISTIGFPILLRCHLYIESGPCISASVQQIIYHVLFCTFRSQLTSFYNHWLLSAFPAIASFGINSQPNLNSDLSHAKASGIHRNMGPVSISDKRFYHKILWSLGSCKINSLNYHIALKFGRHFGSPAAEVPVKCQSDQIISNTNIVASKLCEIIQ